MTKRVSLSKSAALFNAKLAAGEPVIEASTNAPETTQVEATPDPVPATSPEAVEPKKIVLGKLRLPAETKETKLYLITPKMGGHERWFEKKRLGSMQKDEAGIWEIELPEPEIKSRKLAA